MSEPEESRDTDVLSTRRKILQAAGSSFGALFLTETSVAGKRNTLSDSARPSASNETKNLVAEEFPGYPDNPFIITNFGGIYLNPVPHGGNRWPPVGRHKEMRTFQQFHPDVLDFAPLNPFTNGNLIQDQAGAAGLDFGLDSSLPTTAAWNINITADEELAMERYGPILEEESWTYPNGEPVENPRALVAEEFNGDLWTTYPDLGAPSAFAPGALDIHVKAIADQLAQGFTGAFIDDIPYFRRRGLDFSVWAVSAFQDHLAGLSEDRLDELRIDDPAAFDIRSYLKSEGVTPQSRVDPREDPIFREYQLFHHLGIDTVLAEIRQRLKSRFAERWDKIALWGNLGFSMNDRGTGNHRIRGATAPGIYAGEHLDVINTESWPRVQSHAHLQYKLLTAIGKFEKTVKNKCEILGDDGNYADGFDPEQQYPMFQRFQAAEAYANGVIQKLPVTSRSQPPDRTITQWIQNDGSLLEESKQFLDFLWAHKRFLHDTEPDSSIAVIFSLSDRVWKSVPQWLPSGWDDKDELDSFSGAATILHEAHIPYDVLIFGHPDLWDDTELLERLPQYEAIVLPHIDTISDAQVSALQEYVSKGGTVITSGTPPQRDSMYESRDDLSSVFNHDNTRILDHDPGLQRIQQGTSDGSLIETVQEIGIKPLKVESDESLGITRRIQPDEEKLIIHLLNREYTKEWDSFDEKTDISLQIPAPDHEVGSVRYYSSQETTDLEMTDTGEAIEVEVPSLTEWGFVVAAPSADHFRNTEDKEQARSQTTRAKKTIQQQKEANSDWSPEFVTAEIKHEAAEMALEHNAYTQAKSAAEKAISAAENAYRQPTIGIDQAHGQIRSQGDKSFEWLQSTFDSYAYEMITDWTADVLSDVDILFVPPALQFRGARYNFTESELAQIEAFVKRGNSLVVLGRGGMEKGINALTDRFGFRFNRSPILFPDDVDDQPGHPKSVAPVSWRHELTQAVPRILAGRRTTPIEEMPENASVLARMPAESRAWIHTEKPKGQKTEAESSAAGKPIYAVAQHGRGHVALLGNWLYLYTYSPNSANRLMDNLLSTLGREGVRSASPETTPTKSSPGRQTTQSERASETQTPGSVPATETAEGTQATTSVSGPGFTPLTGVASIFGGLTLYKILSGKESE